MVTQLLSSRVKMQIWVCLTQKATLFSVEINLKRLKRILVKTADTEQQALILTEQRQMSLESWDALLKKTYS